MNELIDVAWLYRPPLMEFMHEVGWAEVFAGEVQGAVSAIANSEREVRRRE